MEAFHKEANTSKGTEILYFEDAELMKSKAGQNVFATTGPLSILYVKEYKRFFLQINDWRYPLMRRIPVSKEGTQSTPSYTFPGLNDSSYTVTLSNLGNREILSNFETILNHNSNFSSSGEENTLRKLEVSPDDKLTRRITPVRKESGVKDVISEGLKTVTDKVKATAGSLKGSKNHPMKKKRSNPDNIKAKDFIVDAKTTFKKNFFTSSTKLSQEFLNRRKENINLSQLREFNDLRKTADNSAASLFVGKEEYEEAILDAKDIISQRGYTMDPLEKKGIMQSLRQGIHGIKETITGALGGHKAEGTEGTQDSTTSTETTTTTTTRRSETSGTGISQNRPSREIISVHDKIEKVPAGEGMSHYAA